MIIGVDDGTIAKCDGLEYEGKLWLVPQWYDVPAQGVTKPARLIRFDSLAHQGTPGSQYGVDYVVNYPIPKDLFDVRTPLKLIPGFECMEMPEIEFPLPKKKLS
jgi:hypothetical protein